MGLHPGQWCTVTIDGVGLRWDLPKNTSDVWRTYELEYDAGRYRTRVGGGAWSKWQPARVVDGLLHVPPIDGRPQGNVSPGVR